jgi:hypothetical protein
MMKLNGLIKSAEHKYKKILEDFFILTYNEKSLPSHGIDHHRRVWNYAKEITNLLAACNTIDDPLLPDKLIITCYFHDIGMSVDPGFRHGNHSRNLCIKFLEINHLKKSDYSEVLLAIENHDNKEYRRPSAGYDLLTILSVADDLDAFGFIGIYRYSEIYLTRGINPTGMGHLIMENAQKRFDNFINCFGFADSLVQKQRWKYEILKNFFIEYNEQVLSYKFEGIQPIGYCGIMEFFIDIVNGKLALEDICRVPEKYSDDHVIKWFFNSLEYEQSNSKQKILRI